MNKKEIRKTLRDYFCKTTHHVNFVRCKNNTTLIDVEYVDFRSEQVVETEIRQLLGNGFLINIKRECSESLMNEIKKLLFPYNGNTRLLMHLMSSYTVDN